MYRNWKSQLIKSAKIALAAVIAIAVARIFELKYETTAGIVTILSIQNTKRETMVSARNRGLAFLCALVIAIVSFFCFDFTLFGFGIYLLCFSFLCMRASWIEAIAMDSVLISHLLMERSYDSLRLSNEALLFIIGTGMGIIVNLHLRKRGSDFDRLAEVVDDKMKVVLNVLEEKLLRKELLVERKQLFAELRESIDLAKECAIMNLNNSLLRREIIELDYIQMREQQSGMLYEIYAHLNEMEYLPPQAETIASLIEQIVQEYHKENTVEVLLGKLEFLYDTLKSEPLPLTREEFEVRAVLFYILIELRKLLEVKREFILNRDN